MGKLPKIFFFVTGLAIGASGLWLLQRAGIAKQKPLCENLELELDLMKLRSRSLQLRMQQQDSIIYQFRQILKNFDDPTNPGN